jgi:hypothetical protein
MPAGVFIPFMGFTPSVDPTRPGAVLDCKNVVPTTRGLRGAPSPIPFGNPAFPSAITGAATCELLNGTYRTFAGNATDLYEIIGSSNNNVSATAGAYTGGANPWRFVQFGNATVATNGSDLLQQSISSGAFSAITGSPKANILEVVQGFVFALGTTDSTNGSRPHGWWCSGLYDQTQWTPSQSTQCANGIIVDQPGPITAGRALGSNIIVYKAQSMFYGTYQGPPVIWAMNLISPIVGTPCQECVVPVGARHLFLGTDKQVYEFDGQLPVPIGDEVHEWLSSTWSSAHQSNVQSYYDQSNSLVYWYFVSVNSSSGTIDTCLVYNHRTGKFGRADLAIQAAVMTVSGQITWSGMGSLPGVSTWSTLPQVPYNSSYWTASSPRQGVIDSTNTTQSLSGATQTAYVTTGWLGDDYNYIDYLGFVPRFSQMPATCTGIANTTPQLGAQSTTQWPLGSYYDGELAADFSARYCQVQLTFGGSFELLGMTPRIGMSGEI